MTKVTYSPSSLYGSTNQVSNIIEYLDFWKAPNIVASTEDQLLILPSKYHLRPDLLSYDSYTTSGYWWVFMMRNPDVIKDPIWDFVTGIQIYIPAKNNLPRTTG